MTALRLALAAAAFAVVAAPSGAVAAEPRTVAAHESFILDEYNVDVHGAPDSSRIAVGLSFGTVYDDGWWWTAGPRLSWVRWDVDVPQQTGFGVGGTFGAGWHPDRIVSPFAGFTLERDFSVGGLFEWQTLVQAGARVKVTTDPREHFTMTFALYRANVLAGDGPRGGDTGIAVLYSAVLFAKHR